MISYTAHTEHVCAVFMSEQNMCMCIHIHMFAWIQYSVLTGCCDASVTRDMIS